MLATDMLAAVELIAFDFDGVFTDNSVYVSQDGVESVRCWRSDGLGLSRVSALGVHLIIISTEKNPIVSVRAKKLKLVCKQGIEDKSKAILETCIEIGISPKNTMFVGNDINDIPAFKVVGVPVAVADACPEVFPYVSLCTATKGGYGAVREICDLVFNAKTISINDND